VDEMRKKSQQAAKQGDEKVVQLLDAKQVERLKQLSLQRDGAAAFARPEIAKQLGLSPDQVDKIRRLQGDGMPPFGRGPGPDDRQLADAVAVLTAEQKTRWAELKGKDFKFPEVQFGFGFGFGGPGGPGGPGGQ